MKRLPTLYTRKEQSSSNSSTVPAYAGPNKLLMRYLDSKKFEEELEQARLEKGETK